MIGRITDSSYIVPLDVYVQRHYNRMLYKQTGIYMEAILCERYEEFTDYLTKEVDKLRSKIGSLENRKIRAQGTIKTGKHDAEWKEEHINKIINRIKESNKMPILEFQNWHMSILTAISHAKSEASAGLPELENKLNEEVKAEEKEFDETYLKWIKDLKEELTHKLRVAKAGIKNMMVYDVRPYVRKNAENVVKHASIFSKDDDRLNKVKARHNLSKLYLTSILEKCKEEKAKLVKLYGEELHVTDNTRKQISLSYRGWKGIQELRKKYEENDKIKVECKELEMRINNIFNHLCKRKLIKVINDLREQKAKAKQEYEETYTKWDIISENRATLLGDLHKQITDNINLKIECLILQYRIDFCMMRNPFLEKISNSYLGLDYL